MANTTAHRRLLKEWRDWNKAGDDAHDGLVLRPRADDRLDEWDAWLPGPPESPYAGGYFRLQLSVPAQYPITPPRLKFLTKVCHPNINVKTGEVCVDVLAARWSPAWTLESICRAMQVLLLEPDESSPLNCDASNLLRCRDFRGYHSLVRMYTQLYATERPLPTGAGAS